MTISFSCSGCGRAYKVPDDLAGRSAKCKMCGMNMSVPAGAGGEAPADDDWQKTLSEVESSEVGQAIQAQASSPKKEKPKERNKPEQLDTRGGGAMRSIAGPAGFGTGVDGRSGRVRSWEPRSFSGAEAIETAARLGAVGIFGLVIIGNLIAAFKSSMVGLMLLLGVIGWIVYFAVYVPLGIAAVAVTGKIFRFELPDDSYGRTFAAMAFPGVLGLGFIAFVMLTGASTILLVLILPVFLFGLFFGPWLMFSMRVHEVIVAGMFYMLMVVPTSMILNAVTTAAVGKENLEKMAQIRRGEEIDSDDDRTSTTSSLDRHTPPTSSAPPALSIDYLISAEDAARFPTDAKPLTWDANLDGELSDEISVCEGEFRLRLPKGWKLDPVAMTSFKSELVPVWRSASASEPAARLSVSTFSNWGKGLMPITVRGSGNLYDIRRATRKGVDLAVDGSQISIDHGLAHMMPVTIFRSAGVQTDGGPGDKWYFVFAMDNSKWVQVMVETADGSPDTEVALASARTIRRAAPDEVIVSPFDVEEVVAWLVLEEDERTHSLAETILREITPRVAEQAVLPYLEHEKESVRERARDAHRVCATPACVDLMKQFVAESEDGDLARHAAWMLEKHARDSIDDVDIAIMRLRSPRHREYHSAIHTLTGKTLDKTRVPAVVEVAADYLRYQVKTGQSLYRPAGAEILLQHGDAEHARLLARSRDDEMVRRAKARWAALSPDDFNPVNEAIVDIQSGEHRRIDSAVETLVSTEPDQRRDEVVSVLETALKGENNVHTGSKFYKPLAVWGGGEQVTFLIERLNASDRSFERRDLLAALALRGDEQCVEAIEARLYDAQDRKTALSALAESGGGKKTEDMILGLLYEDLSSTEIREVFDTIAQIGTRKSVQALVRLMRSPGMRTVRNDLRDTVQAIQRRMREESSKRRN